MSDNAKFRKPAFRSGVLTVAPLIFLTGTTGDGASAMTVQQCNVKYARCINRAIENGKGDKTLVLCDTMGANCVNNASDRGNYVNVLRKKRPPASQLPPGKIVDPGHGGSAKRR